MTSSHLALPCAEHLSQMLQIFSYLRKYHNTDMVFNPSDPVIDTVRFERKDWTCSGFGNL